MITEKALYRMKALVFFEKYGLEPTIEAFSVKRRTLFNWKKALNKGNRKIEALNPKKTVPKTKRKRIWPLEIRTKIRLIRIEHPNLGAIV
ncbi:MAG: hypothetical protein ACOX0B_00060 [Minisyncoccales bacterium]